MPYNITYLFVNIGLLLLMFLVGTRVSKSSSYWKYAIWVIVAFSIVEGIRFGRGVDYLHYCEVYRYNEQENQVVFFAFNRILKAFGVPFWGCFFFYAIPFIIGACILLKQMREYAKYLFPLFLISILMYHESFIRQFLGMSFIFVYIALLNRLLNETKEYNIRTVLPLFITAFLAYGIHSVSIVTIFAITIIFIFFKKPLPWQLTIPVFILGKYLVSEIFDWGILDSVFDVISSSDDKLAYYAENADEWFSSDAAKDKYTRNIIISTLETFGFCSCFYLGNKVCNYIKSYCTSEDTSFDRNQIYISLYNCFILGTVVLTTFFNLELVRRISHGWDIYWFVPVGLILYYRNSKCFSTTDKILMIFLAFWLWDFYRFLSLPADRTLFLWDLL